MSNPYLEGNFGPVHDEVTADRPAGHRHHPRAADRSLPAQRAQPRDAAGSRRLPLVRRRRHGPRPAPRRRPGRVVPQPVGAQRHGRRPRWARSAPPAPSTTTWTSRPNTNVIGHHGTTLAIVEAGALPYELGYELDTIGSTDLARRARRRLHRAPQGRSGHRRAARRVYFWGWGNQVQYTVVDTAGKVVTKRMVETTGSPMLHDMSLTERYAVVYDLPVVFDLDAAMAGVGDAVLLEGRLPGPARA